MHIAVKTENAAMVQLLLSKVPNIAQVVLFFSSFSLFPPPFSFLFILFFPFIFLFLFFTLQINYGDETGKTALHLALMKKNSECASLLYTFEV